MLDIVAEVNRMVQNGNTSALFSPVNEYDWVSSDQVSFCNVALDIDWTFSLPLDNVYYYVTIHFSALSEKTLLLLWSEVILKRLVDAWFQII